MATPLSVRLLNPLRIWLGFVAVLTLLLLAAGVNIWHLSASETQRLVELQCDTLLRSHVADLEQGNFRAIIEGLGVGFNNLYVKISSSRGRFEFGDLARHRVCASRQLPFGIAEFGVSTFTLCRPYKEPIIPIIAISGTFFIAAGISLLVVRSLQNEITRSLASFIRSQGAPFDESRGLGGILGEIKATIGALELARQRERDLEKSSILAEIAASVAHDIRSPLAAFDRLLSKVDVIPDRYRSMAINAIHRIREITDDLTAAARASGSSPIGYSAVIRPGIIARQIIAEAKLIYADFPVSLHLEDKSPTATAIAADPKAFGRILSNLINNAVEASDKSGPVVVGIQNQAENVVISVRDQGKGIPPHILEKLGMRGVSYGKSGGLGLGLYHAKKTVEAWGGSLAIVSQEGRGTEVFLKVLEAKEGLS